MYRTYRAYTGAYAGHTDKVDDVIAGINERHETIISVTGVGLDNVWVLIVTKTQEELWDF